MSNDYATAQAFFGRNVLITGAGGSIGTALVKTVGMLRPNNLVLLDHSERNLNELVTSIRPTFGGSFCWPVLGSVCDADLLQEVFDRHAPEIVIHAAAFKHVPLLESNPLAAVLNNAVGTYRLARISRERSVMSLVMLSTDKAVNPISVMGASKRLAELALSYLSREGTKMVAIRLGNVLGTEGSVLPLFLNQIARRGPVTVTHPEATRYFFTMDQAVALILLTLAQGTSGTFVPRVDEPVNILQMATQLIENAGAENQRAIKLSFIGLRPGDKMSEEFLYPNERTEPTNDPRLLRIILGEREGHEIENDLENLAASVQSRDIAIVIEALCRLVPEYRPSETILRVAQHLTA